MLRILFAFSLALPMLAFARGDEPPSRPSADFELACQDVKEKALAAFDGDAQAAMDLADFYGEIGDQEQVAHWYRTAMENGSEAGRLAYAGTLVMQGDAYSVTRARYLLKPLAAKGMERAASLLEEAEGRSVGKELVMASEGPKHCKYFGQ